MNMVSERIYGGFDTESFNIFKIIPYYTGKKSLEEVLKDKKSKDILWLEILFNDSIDWEKELINTEIREAYEKACVWYGNFKTAIESCVKRKPLTKKKGRIDQKEYRKFVEALNFVSSDP